MNTTWHNIQDWGVEGKGWNDTASYFDRLPARAEKLVPEGVWNLSRSATGMAALFETDAPAIRARWEVASEQIGEPNFPAAGFSGLDLYARTAKCWRWVGAGHMIREHNHPMPWRSSFRARARARARTVSVPPVRRPTLRPGAEAVCGRRPWPQQSIGLPDFLCPGTGTGTGTGKAKWGDRGCPGLSEERPGKNAAVFASCGTAVIREKTHEQCLIEGMKPVRRRYLLYLPLRNPVRRDRAALRRGNITVRR